METYRGFSGLQTPICLHVGVIYGGGGKTAG
jgi:hypothetical protein